MPLPCEMRSYFQPRGFFLFEEGKPDVIGFADAPDDYAAFPGVFVAARELAAWDVFWCAETIVWESGDGAFSFTCDGGLLYWFCF